MQNAIEFRNVKKAYGDQVIMENFNLAVEKGEFVTIIGSSGCGKTTALKMVNGLIEPTSGDILVEGENIREKNQTQLRRNIGYAIQGSVLFPHMTVEQNISYVPNLLNKRNKARTKAAVSRWMKIVGLDEGLRDRYPAELSGGQQQRVAIATALVSERKILVLDEPTSGLDLQHMKEVADELITIQEMGKTSLVITHDYELIVSCCTHVLHLEHGMVQEQYAMDAAGLQRLQNFFIESR